MRAIHQFLAGYSRGDAISNEAVVLRDMFRSWGARSELFSERKRILPELRNDALDVQDAIRLIGRDDVVLLHLSIGSMVNDIFLKLNCRKAILYHNITPGHYFRGVQEDIARHLDRGRDQARALAGIAEINLADSLYNADELRAMGYPSASVLPLVLNLSKLREGADRSALKEYADGKLNVLFVGRIAPNKRIEDLQLAFHYFQRHVEPEARLIIAGSYSGLEAYHAYQLTVRRDLALRDVVFTGSIGQSTLNACYRSADLFLCMSDHEGFCIPILEAMTLGVPVLAYAAAAVPGTMDGAGILFQRKAYPHIAEMMGHVARHSVLRDAVLTRQQERIARYEARDLQSELRTHLAPLTGE